MEQTVTIFEHPALGLAVSGREIYNTIALERSRGQRDMFSDWFRSREKKLTLTEGIDFVTVRADTGYISTSNRSMIEFILSLKVAKQFASIQAAGRGKALLKFLTEYGHKPAQIGPEQPVGTVAPVLSFDASQLTLEPKAHLPEMANEPQEPKEAKTPPSAPESLNLPLSPAQQLLQQAQKLVEQEAANRTVTGHTEERLNTIEAQMSIIASLFQKAATALTVLLPVEHQPLQVPAPQPVADNKRARINRLVDAYAATTQVTHQQVWRMLYGQLNTEYHFDAWAHMQPGKDNYLDTVEKHGQLDNMYTIATQRLAMAQA